MDRYRHIAHCHSPAAWPDPDPLHCRFHTGICLEPDRRMAAFKTPGKSQNASHHRRHHRHDAAIFRRDRFRTDHDSHVDPRMAHASRTDSRFHRQSQQLPESHTQRTRHPGPGRQCQHQTDTDRTICPERRRCLEITYCLCKIRRHCGTDMGMESDSYSRCTFLPFKRLAHHDAQAERHDTQTMGFQGRQFLTGS